MRLECVPQDRQVKIHGDGVMTRDQQFTPQAARRWSELDGSLKARLLNNVWCATCGEGTTIVEFTGTMKQGDLILEGRCIRCGGRVARLIEGE
jgi:hypothetical protein